LIPITDRLKSLNMNTIYMNMNIP